MKKIVFTVTVVSLALLFASCGGAKSDAKKLAKKACQCQELEESDNPDKATLDSCWMEAMGMAMEMREQYKDDTNALAVFEKVMNEAEKECVTKQPLSTPETPTDPASEATPSQPL